MFCHSGEKHDSKGHTADNFTQRGEIPFTEVCIIIPKKKQKKNMIP